MDKAQSLDVSVLQEAEFWFIILTFIISWKYEYGKFHSQIVNKKTLGKNIPKSVCCRSLQNLCSNKLSFEGPSCFAILWTRKPGRSSYKIERLKMYKDNSAPSVRKRGDIEVPFEFVRTRLGVLFSRSRHGNTTERDSTIWTTCTYLGLRWTIKQTQINSTVGSKEIFTKQNPHAGVFDWLFYAKVWRMNIKFPESKKEKRWAEGRVDTEATRMKRYLAMPDLSITEGSRRMK